jgi:hypothetical protein
VTEYLVVHAEVEGHVTSSASEVQVCVCLQAVHIASPASVFVLLYAEVEGHVTSSASEVQVCVCLQAVHIYRSMRTLDMLQHEDARYTAA